MPDVVAQLDEHRARQLTDRIRQAADDLWALLLQAYEGGAWTALGYRTWEAYVRAEFDMSRARAYQLVDQGFVLRELEKAAGVSTTVDISEREARDLKPHLEVVKDAIRQAVENVPEERVAEIVTEVVEQERSRIIRQRQDRKEIQELNAEHDPGPDFDWARDQELLRETGAVARVLNELAGFRSASALVADHPKGDFGRDVFVAATRGYCWLAEFIDMWEERWGTR